MKIAILGAGAMGSLFGGLLAEAGQAVTLIDINEAHLGAIREGGLRLETDTGERRVTSMKVGRPGEVTEAPDLLVVFTKTLHTTAALDGVRSLIGPMTQVLSLQNGLGNVEAIGAFVPKERTLIGVTTWPADLVGPGHVHSHGQGAIRLMSADGVQRPAVAEVVAALSAAGLRCEADATVWAAIWEKVAFNAALNSLCAVTGCSVDQLGAVDDGTSMAFAIVSEVVAERELACRVVRCGVATMPVGRTGSEAYLAAQHGLSTEGLVASALRALNGPAEAGHSDS